MYYLRRLAKIISRTPEEAALPPDHGAERAKFALFVILFAALYGVYAPSFFIQLSRWNGFKPDLPLPRDGIKVLYEDTSTPCMHEALIDRSCPANPEGLVLWRSAANRSDPEHSERMQQHRWKKSIWFGIQIEPADLDDARRLRANHLILGRILSSYRLWIDGEFFISGSNVANSDPIVLDLPLTKMYGQDPIRIAIQVYMDSASDLPDVFDGDQGAMGLVTADTAASYRSLLTFWEVTRPFALILSFTLLSCLFFFFWAPSKHRQEYFYMALFGLVSAAWVAGYSKFVRTTIDFDTALRIQVILNCYLGAFGLFLGLAFARMRRATFRVGVPIALISPLILAMNISGVYLELYGEWLNTHWIPFAFYAAATCCLLQAYHLYVERKNGRHTPVRTSRLGLFGVGMAIFATAALIPHTNGVGFDIIWRGFANLGFMLFFAAIDLREYGEREPLVSHTPVSKHHPKPSEAAGEPVAGAFLTIELKNSETVFHDASSASDAAKFLEMSLSHVWNAAVSQGGEIVHIKGDSLCAVFDHTRTALRATDEMAKRLTILEEEFAAQEISCALDFRAGVAMGEAIPVWHSAAGVRIPAWEGISMHGRPDPIDHSARLMSLESKLATLPQHTAVVSDRKSAAHADVASSFYVHGSTVVDSGGAPHEIAVFLPKKRPGRRRTKRAA